MFQENLFKNKTALVTGGGSGIGFTIAKQLLELGARVYIASRKEERVAKAAHELQSYGDCRYAVCDIRDTDSIESLAQKIKEESKTLDILVNNAGGQFLTPAESLNKKGWDAVINNNLNGTWYMTHAMATHFFIPQQHGKIINIIVNIYRGFPGMIHTGAARAGVDNMTKSLAVEWSKYNILVNAIAPGMIYSTGFKQYPEELTKSISQKVPLKRLGTTDEVAYLTTFICSPMADYMTGETIYLDGGWHLWGDIYEL
jgi:citronellol/citronellal dehydrogenase